MDLISSFSSLNIGGGQGFQFLGQVQPVELHGWLNTSPRLESKEQGTGWWSWTLLSDGVLAVQCVWLDILRTGSVSDGEIEMRKNRDHLACQTLSLIAA